MRQSEPGAAWHCVHDSLCQLNAFGIVCEESHTFGELFENRFQNFGVAAAQKHWARPDQIVDIFVSVFVPDIAAAPARDHDPRVEISETASGQNGLCAQVIKHPDLTPWLRRCMATGMDLAVTKIR
jgi:hypothetical protein